MKVYEFWLKKQFKAQAFEVLCDSFYKIGPHFVRAVDEGIYPDFEINEDGDKIPHPNAGKIITGNAVYSVSRNPKTHWTQILVDDNTPSNMIKAIERRIAALKDDDAPLRIYEDEAHHSAPIETPKNFKLEEVLKIRRKQKNGTLGELIPT